jgi:predicted AAA+ superfamily ATPase
MESILQTCKPHLDVLLGFFIPEIFTVSLSQVIGSYCGRACARHRLYTDAQQFFRDSTYRTEGLCMALSDVSSRLMRDNSAPAIHRLETTFGGGRTYPLIALTHVGFHGRKLASVTNGIVDP